MQVASLTRKCFFFLQIQHLVHGKHKKQIEIKQGCDIAKYLIFNYQAETPKCCRDFSKKPPEVLIIAEDVNKITTQSTFFHSKDYHSRGTCDTSLKFQAALRVMGEWDCQGWSHDRIYSDSELTWEAFFRQKAFWPNGTVSNPLFSLCRNNISVLKFLDFLSSNHTSSKKSSFLLLMECLPLVAIQSWSSHCALWDKLLSSSPTSPLAQA